MIIAALKTIDTKDQRSVIHPETIQPLVNLDAQIYCESGICDGINITDDNLKNCLLYTSPSPRDGLLSRMPSSA